MVDQPTMPQAKSFVPVCAIGASAGGVVALQSLFRRLPTDLGLAYVVILHLSPNEPSALSEILAGCTRMPVNQVEDGPLLKPNCVYVIPPNRELVVEGDNVTAREFSEPRSQRAPIDMFFRSIAAGRGDGVAMVLSGAGSDGALGVAAMKESGGIIMVQEPAEAGFPSMPQSAIATGAADFVAPIVQLVERLVEVAHSKEAVRSLDMDGAANDLRRIISLLRAKTGHDFSAYKRATVMRRVIRRMQVCRTATFSEYADHLITHPDEAQNLFSDLLISVTMFFRDEASFRALAQQAIRPIVETAIADGNENIRAWVVGCATGEEAYSIAMLLHEEMARQRATIPFQIFATDLDEGALTTAREGRYPRAIEADVSQERLSRFFVDEGEHFRVRKELRECVLFAKHSVLKEPPFMRLDLIACRNLLIYLERTLQTQVCSIFHYGLRADRYLFLGSAETVDAATDLFTTIDRQARIYTTRPNAGQFIPVLPSFAAPERTGLVLPVARLGAERATAPALLHAEALENNAPASALVDDEQNILHLSPTAGRFIFHSAGPISRALPNVVRPELRLDLRLAIARAVEHGKSTVTLPIVVAFDQERRRVAMQIVPVASEPQRSRQALVFFLDGGEMLEAAGEGMPEANADDFRRLYAELKASQEALLTSRSEHDASVQELRAANEELQSINEEFRSTAEELETSKEELQSINEELHTVNAELKSKLEGISAAHNDLQNLTAATEIGTLFLDPDMRIRMFTPQVAELFNITQHDIGRAITDFTHHLDYEGIAADARKVLHDLVPIEREVRSRRGRHYSLRLRPYRTLEDRIDGTVVTFVDISERAQAVAALNASEERLRDVLNSMDEGFVLLGRDFTILDVNNAALRMDQRPRDSLVGQTHWNAFRGTEQTELGDLYRRVMKERTWGRLEFRYSWPDGRDMWADVSAYPMPDGSMAVFWRDISASRSASEALREVQERFAQFAASSSDVLWIRHAESLEFEYVSPAVQTVFGVSPEAVLANPAVIHDLIVADERERVVKNVERVSAGEVVLQEYRIQRPSDREIRWIRSTGFPLRVKDQRVLRIGAITQDMTDHKLAEAALAEEFNNTRILQDLSARLVTEDNIQTVYEEVLSAAIEMTRAQAGSLQMLDAERQQLVILATRGFSRETALQFERIDVGLETHDGKALRSGERTFLNFDPATTDAAVRLLVEEGLRSAQASPLITRSGRPIGMVSTYWPDPNHRLSEREVRFMDLLARQAADLIEQRLAAGAANGR